jgi:uncharacterized protein (TIGR00369 family)
VTEGRERTHYWQDPKAAAAAGLTMDGLPFLQAMIAGELPPPPIGDTLGYTLREVEKGRAVFEFEASEFHYNPIGSVHGGVYATLLDSATGCAVHSMLSAGDRYTTLDLTVKFLRGITADTGPLVCEGTVIHLGRQTALAEARLLGKDDKLYAHATSSLMIFRP